MFIPLVAIFAVVPVAIGQFNGILGQLGRKPGSCPPFPDVGICEMSCYGDYNCARSLKCCRTACGGTFCISPVTAPISSNLEEKPGVCPRPSGPWVCSSRCKQDSDCRGKKKCCRNRCGANACIAPEEDNSENEVPLII
ncbi:WAP four-disulfide core domain protein 2-like [Anoplophora glabripennis]|uniref:WAP four-disulfide core domain protein 2-like n=1 Tax=Anoplophora glabripennis TaxID=217634 RepID=UPI00087579A8|nr:WAP four-disulfide core domain protein 2-like [Anoplophora glabripennis]